MKKRILVLSMRNPYPPLGGEKYQMYCYINLLLKQTDSVDLIIFSDEVNKSGTSYPPGVNVLKFFKISKLSAIFNMALGLFSGQPLQVSYFKSSKIYKYIKTILDKYDIVLYHTVRLAQYAMQFEGRKIGYLADAISRNYIGAVNKVSFPLNLFYSIEGPRLFNYENYLIGKSDDAIFHSVVDVDIYPDRSRITMIPLLKEKTECTHAGHRNNIVLVANYKSIPNKSAAKNIISYIKKIKPKNYSFELIGPNLDGALAREISNYDSIKYLGIIHNLHQYLCDSFALICPISIGAGMQTKILDAIACGKPCFVTSYSSRPYDPFLPKQGKSPIIEYDSFEELNDKINKLLLDDILYQELCDSTSAMYRNFSPETYEPLFHELFK